MRMILLLAGLCLALGGCAANVHPVGHTDLSRVRPVAGARLALLGSPSYASLGKGNPLDELAAAFRNSGVFAEVTIGGQLSSSQPGYTIEVIPLNGGPQDKYPATPGGAALTFVLTPVIPWRFTDHTIDRYNVFYAGRALASYDLPSDSTLLVSINPLFFLFGAPYTMAGGLSAASQDEMRRFIASREAAWVLNRMQQDGLLTGGAR